jgi:hypothetical protein
MKSLNTVIALALLTLSSHLNAATLRSDPGPYYATSFNNTWQSVWGYNFSASATGVNFVDFDIDILKIGNPLSSSYYDIKVTVTDLSSHSGSFYYTANLPGTGVAAHRTATVNLPPVKSYDITIWVSSSQLPSGTDYWRTKTTNIVVSD